MDTLITFAPCLGAFLLGYFAADVVCFFRRTFDRARGVRPGPGGNRTPSRPLEPFMHYRNGRQAQPGDRVICLPTSGPLMTGLVHSIQVSSQTCNARLAVASPNDPYVTLSDCLHVDDVAEAFPAPGKA
jgi:hypothetical protein